MVFGFDAWYRTQNGATLKGLGKYPVFGVSDPENLKGMCSWKGSLLQEVRNQSPFSELPLKTPNMPSYRGHTSLIDIHIWGCGPTTPGQPHAEDVAGRSGWKVGAVGLRTLLASVLR